MAQSVKILVLGDSGVGKTSLVNFLANPPSNAATYKAPSTTPTVGVNTAVRAIPRGRSYAFIEFIDVTGSRADAPAARAPFMHGAHAAIFVHDGAHPPSARNILAWAEELAANVSASGRSSDDGLTSSARHRRDPRHPAGFAHRRPQQNPHDFMHGLHSAAVTASLESSLFADDGGLAGSGSMGISDPSNGRAAYGRYESDCGLGGPMTPLVRGPDAHQTELPVPTIIIATRSPARAEGAPSLATSVAGGVSTLVDRFQKFTLAFAHIVARTLFLPDQRPIVRAYASHARDLRDAPVTHVVRHLRNLFSCDSATVDVMAPGACEDGIATLERFLSDVSEGIFVGV